MGDGSTDSRAIILTIPYHITYYHTNHSKLYHTKYHHTKLYHTTQKCLETVHCCKKAGCGVAVQCNDGKLKSAPIITQSTKSSPLTHCTAVGGAAQSDV